MKGIDLADYGIYIWHPLIKTFRIPVYVFVLMAVYVIDEPVTSEVMLKVTIPLPLNIFTLLQLCTLTKLYSITKVSLFPTLTPMSMADSVSTRESE